MKTGMMMLLTLLCCSVSYALDCPAGTHLVRRSGGGSGRGGGYRPAILSCVADAVVVPPPPSCQTANGIVLQAGQSVTLYSSPTASDDIGCQGELAVCDGSGTLVQDTSNVYRSCSADGIED